MTDNGIKEELIRQIAEIRQRLGNLEGKVDNLSEDVRDIKRDVKTLNSFRWKQEGIRIGISFLAGVLGAIITIISYLKRLAP